KHSIGDGNDADEELALVVDPGAIKPRLARIRCPGGERNFLLQFAKGRFTQADSADVVVKAHYFRSVIVIAAASDLNRVHLEDAGIGREFLADALVAGGETVALIDGVGNHDAVLAIHQVERRRILVGDAQANFHLGQAGAFQKFVVLAQQAHNLPRQDAGAADAEHGLALALEQRHDDGIAFEKDFGGAIFRQQLVYRIVEIKTEIRSGVHASFHQRASEARRIAHVGLQDRVANHTILGGLLVFRRQELVEHAIERGELADFVVADQIDTVKSGGEGIEPAQVAVI